ncbi:hypothetical protein [Pseudovibrio sp. SPO723]|uniref:hypothetical protein n=1 Tax=Nesiotobacter zosterae TaxID=392721 RepID=UPI0029C5D625|nr:hypothetical protein [Pseudovibrio sp. SPO723]MDX5592584.1 hypothetical protein [Pseudovibrio sp. SPO723]
MNFEPVIEEALKGSSTPVLILIEAHYKSVTHYYHNGVGFVQDIEGRKYTGLGGRASIGNLQASTLGKSRKNTVTLDLSNTDIQFLFEEQQDEVKGQLFKFFIQFFGEGEDYAKPLGPRYGIYTGIGDKLTKRMLGPNRREITLHLEDRFSRQRQPSLNRVTRESMQQRDPDTSGFDYVMTLEDKVFNFYQA